ncbi:MAG: cation diffusion facilitator family transporter [Luteolibacter sp.]
MESSLLQKWMMNVSLLVALALLATKIIAATLTNSSAIYSDAAESVVHLLAVAFGCWAIRFAHKPADDTHHYGHDKVAFLSSGFEGAMIATAAVLIGVETGKQVFYGVQIEHVGLGIALTAAAGTINLALGLAMVAVGKRSGSPLVHANGIHLLTDAWTSLAVLLALGLYHFTGWVWWDPLAAGIAALNIFRVGVRLIRSSVGGLLDESDPEMMTRVEKILENESKQRGLSWHNLRYRHSGHTHWVEFHLVFDDHLSVGEAHALATEIESILAQVLSPNGRVISHLEPRSAENHQESWERS